MSPVLFVTLLLFGMMMSVTATCSNEQMSAVQLPAGFFCKKCPTGWKLYDGRCYIFHDVQVPWFVAEHYCLCHKGNLASIRNENQYNFVRDMIFEETGTNTKTWIGGHDAIQDGTWQWSDGSKFVNSEFTYWGPGEPNNFNGIQEDCLEINFLGEHANDENCETQNAFICCREP